MPYGTSNTHPTRYNILIFDDVLIKSKSIFIVSILYLYMYKISDFFFVVSSQLYIVYEYAIIGLVLIFVQVGTLHI